MSFAADIRFRRYALTALVLLPLLVMSVFPQGTMATRGAQGMEVVLCTGNGPLTVIVDENGSPIDSPHEGVDCGWTVLGQNLCLTMSSGPVPPVDIVYTPVATTERHLAALAKAAAPYPARASPAV